MALCCKCFATLEVAFFCLRCSMHVEGQHERAATCAANDHSEELLCKDPNSNGWNTKQKALEL